jgi:hypothetical protein
MTSNGCKECPSEDVIEPIRTAAGFFSAAIFLVIWLWYSWGPLFPSIGRTLDSTVCFVFKKATLASSVSSKFQLVVQGFEYAAKLKLPQ